LALIARIAAEAGADPQTGGGPGGPITVPVTTVAVPTVPVAIVLRVTAGRFASAGTTPTETPHIQTRTSHRARISEM